MAALMALRFSCFFADLPTAMRAIAASSEIATLQLWREIASFAWFADGNEGPWCPRTAPTDGFLPMAVVLQAKHLWKQTGQLLAPMVWGTLPSSILKRAEVKVYVLGLKGCVELTLGSLLRRANLGERAAASETFAQQWLRDQNLPADPVLAMCELSASNGPVQRLFRELLVSGWVCKVYPVRWMKEEEEKETLITYGCLHGFMAAIMKISNKKNFPGNESDGLFA